MNLSAPFILRPVMTTLVMITLCVIGIVGYNSLPVSNLPDVDYPTMSVKATLPGASPEIMANTVATPLEQAFMTIPGIRFVTSSNTLGTTEIFLEFDVEKHVDLAAVDVQAAIATAKPNLPRNLPQDPVYKKVNPSSTPIVYISITSATMRAGELYDYANTMIGQRLSIIEGVSQVQVYGSPYAVRVQVDPGLTASMNLTLPEIASSIEKQNQYQPLGQLDGNTQAMLLYDNGGLFTAANYNPIVITYKNGAPVRLDEVATSLDSLQNDRSSRRYITKDIDQPSVTLGIQRQPGANAIAVAEDVKKVLESFEHLLPGSVQIHLLFDRSESIVESIWEVKLTLFIAFILVVLVIFFYLGKIRDTIIPSIVMPLSIIITFAIINKMGYTLDNLSLLAVTLAIGFIVDDAIVVLENIVRKIEEGYNPMQASLEGSKQISFTILSMTLSLVAVFIPLLFMAGVIGKLFREFAVTLTVVTVVSGIISLTLTPMLCSRFLSPQKANDESRLLKFSTYVNDKMLEKYKKMLSTVLKYPKSTLAVGALSVLLSIYFFMILPQDFIPNEDVGFMIAYSEAAQGTSSEQMIEYQNQVVEILRQDPSIGAISSNAATPVYRQGIAFLNMVPRHERPHIQETITSLQKKLKALPGVNVYLKNIPLIDLNIGSQVRGNYQYLLQSIDSEELYSSATTLVEKMRSDPIFEGISTDLEIKTPQLRFDIQRDHAATFGVDVATFENVLALSYSGGRISRIETPINQYDVIVELLRELQKDPTALDYLYLRSNSTNQLVPLGAIASWKESVGPASVNHFDQFPAVTITFNISQDVPLSRGLERLQELSLESLSSKVTGEVKGAAATFQESMNSMTLLLIVTIFSIYVVLGILYESFIHPLTILSTLPPAILGALLTLYLTGNSLSLYAYLGIILLVGIVKKNGIMIVDFALENARTKGDSAEKSVFDACVVRFRPIMMTTVAAIMGALPIAFAIGTSSEARRPLGYVIVGGMCISQLITLFLTPVIYLYLEKVRNKFNKGTTKQGINLIVFLAMAPFLSSCCLRDPSENCTVPWKPSEPWAPRVRPIYDLPHAPLQPVDLASKGTLDLSSLVDIALTNNPKTFQSWANARAAAFNWEMSKSPYYPTIIAQEQLSIINSSNTASNFGGGNFNNNSVNGIAGRGADGVDFNNAPLMMKNLSVPGCSSDFVTGDTELVDVRPHTDIVMTQNYMLSYLLLDFGGRAANYEQTRQTLMAANWLHNRTLQTVMIQTMLSYYTYLQTRGLIEAKESQLKDAKTSTDAAENQFTAGVATKVDFLLAKTNLINVQLQLTQLLGQLDIDMGTLAASLGYSASTKLLVENLPEKLPLKDVHESVENFVELALKERPDLAAAYANYFAAEENVTIAWSAGMPTLNSFGNFSRTDSFRWRAQNNSITSGALSLDFPLFTGFFYENGVLRAKEEAKVSLGMLEDLQTTITTEVVDSYYNLKVAVKNVAYSEEYLKYSKEAYEAAFASYKQGVASILDLLTAQTSLANARAQLVNSKTMWITSLANLAYATGILTRNNKL